MRELLNDVERGVLKGDLIKAIGARHPFLLAYQGGNDRALQQIYGEMIGKVIARRFSPAPLPQPPAPGEPIRLGIVSSFFTATPTGKFRSRAGSASSTAAASM